MFDLKVCCYWQRTYKQTYIARLDFMQLDACRYCDNYTGFTTIFDLFSYFRFYLVVNLPIFITHTHTYIYIYIYHHHRVVPLAFISLTLSRHFSLSFTASGRSSGLHSISSHSCWMYIQAGRPSFARPYVGVHKSTSLMSSSLLLQPCPACMVCLTSIVGVLWGVAASKTIAGYIVSWVKFYIRFSPCTFELCI